MPDSSAPDDPFRRLPDDEKVALVRTLVGQTGREGERQALLRYHIGGETRQAICDDFDLPLRHLHRMLHQARTRYQSLLEMRLAAAGGEGRPRRRRRGGAAEDDGHDEIDEQALVERAAAGDLSPEEQARLDAHQETCPRCRTALAAAAELRRQLRSMAVEDVTEVAMARAGVTTWMVRRGRHLGTALAVLVLAVMAAGAIWYGSRLRHQQEQLDLARGATEEQRELLDRERRSAAQLAADLEERRELWAAEREALLDRLQAPRVVVDPEGGDAWTLAVDLGAGPRFASYRVTVIADGGAVEHRREGLRPGDPDLLLVTFPSGSLPPGEHRLVVEGIGADGGAREVALVPFRLVDGR